MVFCDFLHNSRKCGFLSPLFGGTSGRHVYTGDGAFPLLLGYF